MRQVYAVLAAAALACGGDGTGVEEEPINLTGRWTGQLTITTDRSTFQGNVLMQLVHAGSSVTGTFAIVGEDESSPSTFAFANGQLTMVTRARQVASDDCHLFSTTWLFTVPSATEMRLTSVTGQLCDGDGQGGHLPLETITGSSATLRKQ